eukprot:COSAG03_NODE_3292_length_2099_cov_1.155500_2_plen_171_part_00
MPLTILWAWHATAIGFSHTPNSTGTQQRETCLRSPGSIASVSEHAINRPVGVRLNFIFSGWPRSLSTLSVCLSLSLSLSLIMLRRAAFELQNRGSFGSPVLGRGQGRKVSLSVSVSVCLCLCVCLCVCLCLCLSLSLCLLKTCGRKVSQGFLRGTALRSRLGAHALPGSV